MDDSERNFAFMRRLVSTFKCFVVGIAVWLMITLREKKIERAKKKKPPPHHRLAIFIIWLVRKLITVTQDSYCRGKKRINLPLTYTSFHTFDSHAEHPVNGENLPYGFVWGKKWATLAETSCFRVLVFCYQAKMASSPSQFCSATFVKNLLPTISSSQFCILWARYAHRCFLICSNIRTMEKNV